MSAALLFLLPAALATPLLPGRALTAPPCTPEPIDTCWALAPHLRRFVPPRGLLGDPIAVDIQLAHSDGALLVRAADLPADAQVELIINNTFARVGAGIHTIALPGPEALQPASIRLRTPEDLWVWAPSGAPYADETFPLLLADGPALGMPVTLARLDDASLVIEAPAADQLTVVREQPDWPRARRGVPEPWRAAGRDRIDVPRPQEPGWYRVEALWEGLDVVARRVYVDAPPPLPAVSSDGIHPAPATSLPADGAALRLGPRSAVVLTEPGWAAAAALLSEELARLTGRRLPVVTRRPRPGDIVIGRPATLASDVPEALREAAGAEEGFALDLRERAVLSASSLRGASYGALALSDALADGAGAPRWIADVPEIETRVLYQELNLTSGALDLEAWRAFVRRVVVRGRYNTLYLGLRNSVRLESRPELAHAKALSAEELKLVIAAARELGLAVYPAVSTSGHASWLAAAHPARRSSGGAQAICMRDPETEAIVAEVYDELWALFGAPGGVHIGHDEVRWPTERTFGDARDPHCAGLPASVLLSESLRWHIDRFRALGATSIVAWSDMLIEGWNGRETHRALDALTPPELIFAAWSGVGDSLGVLTGRGFEVMRVHTGYYDWKRAGLAALSGQLAGEGLALFNATPWLVNADNPSSRGLASHWSRVLLAGATAWRPALSEVPIAALSAQTAGLPAYMPGYVAPDGPLRAYSVSGSPTAAAWPAASAPPFSRLDPALAAPEQPVVVSVGEAIGRISLLQAASLTTAARQDVQVRGRTLASAPAVAAVTFRYRDGSREVVGLRYGVETFDVDSDSDAASLWGTSGSTALGGGRRGWRVDVDNPYPRRTVDSVEVAPTRAGVEIIVFAAAGR